MRARLPLFLALAGLLLASACSHYRLGTSGRLGFRTLYVQPVANSTKLPQAVAVISTELRQILLQDGRIELVGSPEEADATLSVTLIDFGRDVTSVRPDDTGLARKFDLQLVANCTLVDNRRGVALFENRPVTARQQIFTTSTPEQLDSNQLQAEYQAVPLIARTLADKIAHAALDVW